MNGIFILDKPRGLSSFDATRAVGRALGERRVGHGGTLDPMATGVLPICLGEATKLAAFLLGGDKEYLAELVFGVETDTLDADGAVKARRDASAITEADVRAVLPQFLGPQQQRPPMYSAIRKDGRRLYELARAGLEVEREPRAITIAEIELQSFAPARASIRVWCSKGTYIRVLAADIGAALGVGAHLTALRRTRSGPFTIDQAVAPEDIGRAAILPLSAALPAWPLVRVEGSLVQRVRDGQRLSAGDLGVEVPVGTSLRLVTRRGDLLALAETRADGSVRLLRGFNYGLTEDGPSAILSG